MRGRSEEGFRRASDSSEFDQEHTDYGNEQVEYFSEEDAPIEEIDDQEVYSEQYSQVDENDSEIHGMSGKEHESNGSGHDRFHEDMSYGD